MEKSIIIIGGGLTGLATSCYGQMNSYQTSIFEMHNIAGGLCTGWKRKGYTIDGAMHWLMRTGPAKLGIGFYIFWIQTHSQETVTLPCWFMSISPRMYCRPI